MGKKYIKAILLVVVLLVASMLPVQADTTGESEGSFTIANQPPEEPIVKLYEKDESTETNETTPQVEFAVKIVASDPNGLNDIKEIIVYIYHATDASVEPGSDNPKTQATYKWDSSGWSLVGPTGSTWGIDTNESRGPVNNTSTSGTWWLHFIPGKVATEEDGTSGMWIIKVVVKDQGNLENSTKLTNIKMNWYGEIQVIDDSFDFGNVTLGATNVSIINPNDGNIDIKTISNGNHKIDAKTEQQWSSGSYNVTVVTSEPPGAGQIVLKHNSDNNTTGASVVSPTTYSVIPGLDSLSQTDESGTTSGIYIWLSVGPSGIPVGTYKGKYYVQISNA